MGSDIHLGAVFTAHSLTKLTSSFGDGALPSLAHESQRLSVERLQGRTVCARHKSPPVTALKPDSARVSVDVID